MLYETDADRDTQRRILDEYIATRPGFTYLMMPSLDNYDAMLFSRGRCVALVEVKNRTVRYPTYKIDVKKVYALMKDAIWQGVQAVLVVRFPDKLERAVITSDWIKQHAKFSRLERKDRNDPNDSDIVLEWDHSAWLE